MHKTLDDNDELADMESDDAEFSTSKGRSFSVLAKSFEKFISLGVDRHIVFKDSLNFLPSSLDSLVKNLREEAGNDKKKMKYLCDKKNFFPLFVNIIFIFVMINQEFYSEHLVFYNMLPPVYYELVLAYERSDKTKVPPYGPHKSVDRCPESARIYL